MWVIPAHAAHVCALLCCFWSSQGNLLTKGKYWSFNVVMHVETHSSTGQVPFQPCIESMWPLGTSSSVSQCRCNYRLHSLEGDGVLAAVWLAVPDQEAGLFAGLQLELCLLTSHTSVVPAEDGETRVRGTFPLLLIMVRGSFCANPLRKECHV